MRTLALFVAAMMSSVPAFAADMAVKAPPPPIAAPAYSWTGCYLGGNVGYGWQSNETYDVPADQSVGSHTVTGAVGGGQAGCDYQFASKWLVGVQGMFDGAGVRGSYILPYAYSGDYTETDTFRTDWFGTLTGRIGYAVLPQALLYFKGGAAWLRTSYSDADASGTYYPPYSGQASATRTGWTIGGGAEYAFQPNLSAFVEYDCIILVAAISH